MTSTPLQFERFRVWQVIVPARPDVIFPLTPNSDKTPWDRLPIALIAGQTADGLVAFGEAERGASRDEIEQTLRHILKLDLRSNHPGGFWYGQAVQQPLPGLYKENKAAAPLLQGVYETLWLDAVGKATGLPAHALLGGKVRNHVRVDTWANRPNAKKLSALVALACEQGHSGMKLKCDASGDTLNAISEIQADIPKGFHFTIDPMCSWRTYHESRNHLRTMENWAQSTYLEDPYPHDALKEWERARSTASIPLIWHARNFDILQVGLSSGVADAFNAAGHPAFQFVAAAAAIAGGQMHCWHGSALELGILQHARLHACAVSPACEMPSDLLYNWVREHTLVTPVAQFKGNLACVPDSPGLGIILDEEAIEHYHIDKFEIR